MKIIKSITIRSLAVGLFLTLQFQASAHAFLDHANPKVGSTIADSPATVKIWFTQELEPVFSSIQVTDERGKEVDKKDVHLDARDKTQLIISLPPLGSGIYTVTWHVVSVDTHRTQGHFKFTIK